MAADKRPIIVIKKVSGHGGHHGGAWKVAYADFVTAMITSVRAVVASPVPMIGWAAVIVVLLIVSALPYFLGLLVTLPVLGHATWHLYRRIVVPVAG